MRLLKCSPAGQDSDMRTLSLLLHLGCQIIISSYRESALQVYPIRVVIYLSLPYRLREIVTALKFGYRIRPKLWGKKYDHPKAFMTEISTTFYEKWLEGIKLKHAGPVRKRRTCSKSGTCGVCVSQSVSVRYRSGAYVHICICWSFTNNAVLRKNARWTFEICQVKNVFLTKFKHPFLWHIEIF